VNGATPGPTADSITIAETLELLENDFVAMAQGVADNRYALWLGSGISKERFPDIGEIIRRVLTFMQVESNGEEADGPHRKALGEALDIAKLSQEERDAIDLAQPPEQWPNLDVVVERLWNSYSGLFDIRVEGKDADYLLWNGLDVRTTYGADLTPDCEHLCIAILALEGVLSDVTSTNWDGLIEGAAQKLNGSVEEMVRVIVLPEDLRKAKVVLDLLKFHGCAVLAERDPGTYREALIASRSQIIDWTNKTENEPIRDSMKQLATSKPTLMVGLSAQDENIQQLFSAAKASMPWTWPGNPPAHIFSANTLGQDHRNILKVVYDSDYDANMTAIEEGALIKAYAKPLFAALALYVITEKLRIYLREVHAPQLDSTDYDELAKGLGGLCRKLAEAADDHLEFIERVIAAQRRALELFQQGVEPEAAAAHGYRAIGNLPCNRIPSDTALATNGIRELATALAILGRGEEEGHWTVSTGSVDGVEGVVKVSTDHSDSAVYFAANGKASVRLHTEISGSTGDVVIINSTEPPRSSARSPGAKFGRTGGSAIREVDMSTLLESAPEVGTLETNFRQEAAL
jgi:SIR2-like domain